MKNFRVGYNSKASRLVVSAIVGAVFTFAAAGVAQARDEIVFEKVPSSKKLVNILFAKTRVIDFTGSMGSSKAKAPSAREIPGKVAQNKAKKPSRKIGGGGKAISFLLRFDVNSDTIKEESVPYLESLAEALKDKRAAKNSLVVEGHTDASGSDDYNRRLSFRRAIAVKQYMVQNLGVESWRLIAIGMGESYLLDEADPYNHKNRRVQFRLYN
jgi:outer membrane protein OmpA-like peptidoglycan-associated protein